MQCRSLLYYNLHSTTVFLRLRRAGEDAHSPWGDRRVHIQSICVIGYIVGLLSVKSSIYKPTGNFFLSYTVSKSEHLTFTKLKCSLPVEPPASAIGSWRSANGLPLTRFIWNDAPELNITWRTSSYRTATGWLTVRSLRHMNVSPSLQRLFIEGLQLPSKERKRKASFNMSGGPVAYTHPCTHWKKLRTH